MLSSEHAGALEALVKRTAILSLLAVSALQLVLPDISWSLRAIGIVAFCLGWILARSGSSGLTLWLLLAPLAPALAFFFADRQGPAIDVLWMLGLTGALLRTMSWSRWSTAASAEGAPFNVWTVLLGGWAMVLSLTWPIVVLREAGFDLRALRDMDAITSWAMLPAPQAIGWTLYVVQAQLLALFWFERVRAAFEAAPRLPPPAPPAPLAPPAPPGRLALPLHALWAGTTLASVVAVIQGTVDIGFLNPEFWVERIRATGTMLDANAYGTAAALAGPIGFLALRRLPGWGPAAGVLVLALNWTGVWVSGSWTASLCALGGAAGLALGLWRAHDDAPAPRRALSFVAAAGAVSLVVLFTAAAGPLQRSDREAPSADTAGLAALWNRGGYGSIAMTVISEYPLTGVGPGAYRYLAPDYWRVAENDQLALDNAQNWWRHQAAELGLLGAASVMFWSLLVAWQVIAARARPAQALPAWTVRGLLAGLGACSLVGMPTQNPLVLLWFFFLVAWLMATTETTAVPSSRAAWVRRGWFAVVVLAIGTAAGQLVLARGSLSVDQRAMRFKRPHVEGAYAPEPLPGSGEFRWTDDQSRFILPVRGKTLIVRLWAHHPDIARQPVAVTIDGPCGELFRQNLTNKLPIAVGMTVPEDIETVDAVIRVSRTWQPADYGAGDRRTLGVAVVTDFVDTPQAARSQDYRMDWGKCPAGR